MLGDTLTPTDRGKQVPARERSYTTRTPTKRDWKLFNANGSLNSSGVQVNGLNWMGEEGSISDFVTPNWKALISAGKILNNPMSATKTTSWMASSPITLYNPNGTRWEYSGTDLFGSTGLSVTIHPVSGIPPVPAGVDLDISRARNDALLKAYSEVAKSDTLALVTLVELRKTVDMVTSVTGGLVSGIKLLAGGSTKKAVLKALMGSKYKEPKAKDLKWSAKTLSGKWLEVRYGWVPTLYDLEGTLAALNAIRYPRLTARGTSATEALVTSNHDQVWDPTNGHRLFYKFEKSWKVSVRAYVLYTVEEAWFKAHRLGLLCPLTTVWELVPFSFVVDWFVNIGEWLDAISPRPGVKYLCHGYTDQSEYTQTLTCTSTTSNAGGSVSGAVGQKNQYFSRKRSRVVTVDQPIRPQPRVRLNTKRAIDSIALLVQTGLKVR